MMSIKVVKLVALSKFPASFQAANMEEGKSREAAVEFPPLYFNQSSCLR
jgi:hypothetical protein